MTSMTHADRRPRLIVFAALLAVAVLLAASCSSEEPTAEATSTPGTATTEGDGPGEPKRESLPPADDTGPDTEPPDDDTESDTEPPDDDAPEEAEPDDAGTDSEAPGDAPDPSCEPGEGRTITEIDDVVTDEVVVDPVVVEDQEVDGETVPGFEIPGFTIAGQTVDGGCIVEYDAPAGCLGRVEVTGVTIPGTAIPAVEVPGVDVPGGDRAEGGSEAEASLEAVTVEGAEEPQVCRPEPPEGGGYVPTIYRDIVYRDIAYRDILYRDIVYRDLACTDGADCLTSVTVPSVTVPSVTVPSVTVPSRTLEGRDVGGLEEVPVYGDDQETAYLAPADVLFDFDSDELRPSADPVLGRIADEARKAGNDARITVDGHTDARGDDDYNLGLSERRAQAVADWLVERGDLDGDAITVTGFGESAPVAPNETSSGGDDPDGRQQNRRVVIGVEV